MDDLQDIPLALTRDGFARVCSTDEWDQLVGVVDEFFDEDQETTEKVSDARFAALFFPCSRSELRACSLLQDVNEFTSWVKGELRKNNGRGLFPLASLERVDKTELL